jgi:hypothetical protein
VQATWSVGAAISSELVFVQLQRYVSAEWLATPTDVNRASQITTAILGAAAVLVVDFLLAAVTHSLDVKATRAAVGWAGSAGDGHGVQNGLWLSSAHKIVMLPIRLQALSLPFRFVIELAHEQVQVILFLCHSCDVVPRGNLAVVHCHPRES